MPLSRDTDGLPFDLDGLKMNAPVTAEGGVVNAQTIFSFRQRGSVVSAEYQGGGIEQGHLVGLVTGACLEFRYAQIDSTGRLDGGHSKCELTRTPDGRVRIVEHFEWASRKGTGVNVIEELPS
jgi:hypothetical protein